MYTTTPIFDLPFSGDERATVPRIRQEEYSSRISLNSTVSTEFMRYVSEECKKFRSSQDGNISFISTLHDPPIRLVIASISFIENLIVIIALLNSWRSLRQNIYIFAISIAISDCFLGLIHISNSVIHGVMAHHAEGESIPVTQSSANWFYLVRGTSLMSAQVASTGNAACLVFAFRRYVHVLAPVGNSTVHGNNSRNMGALSSSRLLSRNVSYVMTSAIWIASAITGVIPLIWNCGKYCGCFSNTGDQYMNKDAVRCLEHHGCSYLLPPLKSATTTIWLAIFFFALFVLIFSCIQVVNEAGGMIACLPYRLHKIYARRRKSSVGDLDSPVIPARLRKRSVQMNYMRDMMHFMIMLSAAFVFCKLPFTLLLLVESVTHGRLDIPTDWVTFLVLLGYFDSIINPIIFGVALHGMKEAFKKLFLSCCTTTVSVSYGKKATTPEEQPNQAKVNSTTI